MSKTITNPIYAVYEETEIIGYYNDVNRAQKVAKSIIKQHNLLEQYETLTPSTQLEPNHVYLKVNSDQTYQFMMTDPFNGLSPVTGDFFLSQSATNPIVKQISITTPLNTEIKEIEVQ